MSQYTVSQLSKISKVSVRTLHHYDSIGLLKPAARTVSGYRIYKDQELIQLQQILFFRELDFSLNEIKNILASPNFSVIEALKNHRQLLTKKRERLAELLKTVDKTILKLEEKEMVTDQELYRGFKDEDIARYKQEAREHFGEKIVADTENKIRQMPKAEWAKIQMEGEELSRAIANLVECSPQDQEVQELINRHYHWLYNFYTPSLEMYQGLANLYTTHPGFREHFDKYRPGLADFMKEAMQFYVASKS